MDINTLFATAVGRASHKELVKKAATLFDTTKLQKTVVGNFNSNLRAYLNSDTVESYGYSDEALIDALTKVIVSEAEAFSTACGYNAAAYEFTVKRLWLNEMESGTFHQAHSHYGSAISGCFYVELPENTNIVTFTGPLSRIDKFELGIKEYTPYNSTTWTAGVEVGDMLFWESYLKHEVPVLQFDGVRRSIAFDVDVKEVR